jgi:hypothetical protein
MKKLLAIAALLALTGCSAFDAPFAGMSQADDFDCKQKCGMFDPRAGIVGPALCMNQCAATKPRRFN